ncbi:hypothetical protein BBK82_03420 [Lentzea guizhouensis]|uniref:Uncharacterized protein n=1 Tax=Lentzea guizhouensis TaxID=1586287 RepID=A0A1B2HC16_9PSEU|nr:hypothetical protein [Lentzea guizhouensis]ANZ35265.1 hypothetical protein BBK82_03420 [Lentzea guizhouensis]
MTRHQEDDDPIDILKGAVQEETAAAAEQAAEATVARSNRRWLPVIMGGVLVVSLLISAAVALAVVDLYSKQTQVAAAVSEIRQLAEDAKTAGDVANAQLERRGQQPVPIPQPGEAQDSDVLVAAATARVLASLPDSRPTADQVVAAVAAYVAANMSLFGPSPQQIRTEVAAYFQANPPPSGPPGVDGQPGRDGEKGDKGEKGDPPTAAEIEAVWVAYLRDNPDALCPRGGSFAQLRVQLADGGTADTWQCVVAVTPPSSSTTRTPVVPTF